MQAVKAGHTGTYAEPPRGTNASLYGDENPLGSPTFAEKVKLLETIDAYAREKDQRVRQVTASLAGSYQEVEILRADGTLRARRAAAGPAQRLGRRRRRRPAGIRLATAWAAARASRASSPRTAGSSPSTRRCARRWSTLDAVPAPAGTFDVVLGPGWPGILLHEAVGHGLEGDFNRKEESAFAGLMGQRVASPGVTVVDDGTHRRPARLAHRRRRGHADRRRRR